MNYKDILKIAAVGALVYGAYKLGERRGEKKISPSKSKSNLDYEEYEEVEEDEDYVDDVELDNENESEESKSEIDYIQELIDNLKSKPNKNKNDRNTIELLEIKLKQLLKGK